MKKSTTKPEFESVEEFLSYVEERSRALSFHQMIELKSRIHKVYVKRFKQKQREPKYGNINKGFTELELQHFLRNVPNDKFRLLFKYQAFLGLRIGEVCGLHVSNIDFEKRELTIKSEKRQKTDSMIIPMELFKETIEFINKHEKEVVSSEGYIFFKDRSSHNVGLYVDCNYVRGVFRRAVIKSGLDSTYAYTDETLQRGRPRALHRLTTHSLRHYAITHFSKSTNGNLVLSSRFARHSNPSITMRYIAKDKEELYKSIDFVFSSPQLKSIKSKLGLY